MYVVNAEYTDTVHLLCRFASSQSQPSIDASQDITDASVVHQSGVTTVTFTRQRVTSDTNDVDLDQCVYFLFAWGGSVTYGNPHSIAYHGTNRGALSPMICLPSSSECPIASEWNTLAV